MYEILLTMVLIWQYLIIILHLIYTIKFKNIHYNHLNLLKLIYYRMEKRSLEIFNMIKIINIFLQLNLLHMIKTQ